VATAFPDAQVEVWATDEHRIGLKPILKRVWTLPGQRPLRPVALVEPRYDWRYLVAFAHPASGRTLWQLATAVSTDVFSVELAAFAAAVGAGPHKQVILVLDGAGWRRLAHESRRARARPCASAVSARAFAGVAAVRASVAVLRCAAGQSPLSGH
jgi:hypothetical protein